MLVSIVVPSFNQGHFIGATIDSILRQDYAHIEVMVIDGGSIDETVNILKTYDDPRLIWISEPDSGQSNALNKGMHLAKGSLLSYLNSDDLLLPGAVSFAVNYLATHTDIDLVYGDCNLIDSEGQFISVKGGQPFTWEEFLLGNNPVCQPGTFWRREVFQKLGEFDETLHYAMDGDYWARAVLTGFNLQYEPGSRSAFRLHDTSKTVSSKYRFFSDRRALLDKIYAEDNLPIGLQKLRAAGYAYADWGIATGYWTSKNYVAARPLLQRFLRDRLLSRRALATTMLIDSYLHTPFTWLIRRLYKPVMVWQ